jgi:hypothetical protein
LIIGGLKRLSTGPITQLVRISRMTTNTKLLAASVRGSARATTPPINTRT